MIDGCLGLQNAIWSKDILYERRLVYNTMGGFSSTHKTKWLPTESNFYKGTSFKVLEDKVVRYIGDCMRIDLLVIPF